jgi:hypothetical protein
MTTKSTDFKETITRELTGFIQSQARALSLAGLDRLTADLPALRERFAKIPAQTYGLRSLYFLLAGVVYKFVYLRPALAIILSFIGAEMLLADVYHIPTAASLGIVGLVLLAAIGLSLFLSRQRPAYHENRP